LVNEESVREKARDALRSGKLPRRNPDRTWGGLGVGAMCTICDLPMRRDEMEFEIQFARDDSNLGSTGCSTGGCGDTGDVRGSQPDRVLLAPALHPIRRPNDGPSRLRRRLGRAESSLTRAGRPVGHHVDAAPRGWQMTPIETVRRLLVDAPGIAICDSCLARSCSISLGEMRHITAMLLKSAGFGRHDRCWSCSRNVTAVLFRAKCVHCSLPIESSDEAVIIGADMFHAACRKVLDSREVIRASLTLERRSLGLIDGSLRRMRKDGRSSG
jgi:hypothetical protein